MITFGKSYRKELVRIQSSEPDERNGVHYLFENTTGEKERILKYDAENNLVFLSDAKGENLKIPSMFWWAGFDEFSLEKRIKTVKKAQQKRYKALDIENLDATVPYIYPLATDIEKKLYKQQLANKKKFLESRTEK